MLAVERAVMPDSGWRSLLRRVPNGAVLYLPGLEGGGSVKKDYSGKANNGTITGNSGASASFSVQIDTATYDAFGTLLQISSDSYLYVFTQGTAHSGDKKKIVGQFFTPSTNTWGARFDIYADADADISCINPGAGIIGTNIYVFFTRAHVAGGAWANTGYIKSTDLTASSWGAYTTIAIAAVGVTSSMGNGQTIISTNVAGTYLIPFYGQVEIGVSRFIALFKTTDSGANWALGATIWSDAIVNADYAEPVIAHIGSGKIVCLARGDAGGVIVQSVSADNGETWGAFANTNLGTAVTINIPCLYYDEGTDRLVCIYHDRAAGYWSKVSWGNAQSIYASPTAWGTSHHLIGGFEYNGYHSFVKVSTNRYFDVFSKQVNAGDADIWGGYIDIALTPWKRISSGVWGLRGNGVDDYTDFGTPANMAWGTDDYTIIVWVIMRGYNNGASDTTGMIIGANHANYDKTQAAQAWALYVGYDAHATEATRRTFIFSDRAADTTFKYVRSASLWAINTPILVACKRVSGALFISTNGGAFEAGNTGATMNHAQPNPLKMMMNPFDAGGGYLNGEYYLARAKNTEVTDSEISFIYGRERRFI